MEAAVAVEVPAVEVRDRLVGFVEAVTRPLPLRRQRETDRVTFYLEPCGSGGRMINEEAYYHSAP